LKARGIWQKVQNGLNAAIFGDTTKSKFNTIHATGGFAIVITSGADYPNGYSTDGYKVLLREGQISEYSANDIGDCILYAIDDDMTIARAVPTHDNGWRQLKGHAVKIANANAKRVASRVI